MEQETTEHKSRRGIYLLHTGADARSEKQTRACH